MYERMQIRDRILARFAMHCALGFDGASGDPEFSIDRDQLTRIVETEFGVHVPVELIPESFTVEWLVQIVEELTSDPRYVM